MTDTSMGVASTGHCRGSIARPARAAAACASAFHSRRKALSFVLGSIFPAGRYSTRQWSSRWKTTAFAHQGECWLGTIHPCGLSFRRSTRCSAVGADRDIAGQRGRSCSPCCGGLPASRRVAEAGILRPEGHSRRFACVVAAGHPYPHGPDAARRSARVLRRQGVDA